MIKNHKEYSYDEILDKYNSTKDYKFLSYARLKFNKINVLELYEMYNVPYEELFMYIYNIQRELDNLEPLKSIYQVKSLFNVDDMEQDEDE